MAARAERPVGIILALIGCAVTAVAAFGGRTSHARFNFGPGDSPFVRGFAAETDVEDKVGWHWTTYDASISLPLVARDAEVTLNLRYARMFAEEAVVEPALAGAPLESFRARGGQIKETELRARRFSGPLDLRLRADSHERRNMGLRMDRMEITAREGDLRLSPSAARRTLLAVVLVGVAAWLLSGSTFAAGFAMSLFGAAFASLSAVDLFDAWRVIRLMPEVTVLSVLVLGGVRIALLRLTLLGPDEARLLAALALAATLFRLGLVSQPDYYYPDLMTHARAAATMAQEGPAFFVNPAAALGAQGAWTKSVLGASTTLPYAVVFHTPFAVAQRFFDWSLDDVETAMKSAGCLVSSLPILLGGAFAALFGVPASAAALLAITPVYASRVGYALLPALTGHVMDLVVLVGVARLLRAEAATPSLRDVVGLIGILTLGHLTYTSGVMNEGLFMAVLCLVLLSRRRAALSLRLGVAEALAAGLALALYYRSFLGDLSSLAARVAGGASGAPSQYPIESFFGLLVERLVAFFGPVWLVLALLGVALTREGRDMARSAAGMSWGLAFLGLILLRAKVPDVFRYGHETLFVTPLIVLLAGAALAAGWKRGGAYRLVAVVLVAALVAGGVAGHATAVSEHFQNAR